MTQPRQATIEIRSVDVGDQPGGFKLPYIPGKGKPQHLFIIHTDSNGKETIFRAGTEHGNAFIDNIKVIKQPYRNEHGDYPIDRAPNAPRVIIASGTDQEINSIVAKMWKKAQQINAGKYDYKIPYLLGHEQNSNTVVRILVEAAGLQPKLPKYPNGKEVWAPSFDYTLKHTSIDNILRTIDKGDIRSYMPAIEQTDSCLNNLEFTTRYLYEAQKGDTVWEIARNYGVNVRDILSMPGNEAIAQSYKDVGSGSFTAHLSVGQNVALPEHAIGSIKTAGRAPECAQGGDPWNIFTQPHKPSFARPSLSDILYVSSDNIFQGLHNFIHGPTDVVKASGPAPKASTTSMLDVQVGDFGKRHSSIDMGSSFQDGIGLYGASYVARMPASILNGDGLVNVAPSSLLTDGWRPGASKLSSVNFKRDMNTITGQSSTPPSQSVGGGLNLKGSVGDDSTFQKLRNMHHVKRESSNYQNIDPIVINLDGAGIRFISLDDSQVVFDVDNDGYLERTAWIKRGNAFLVMDKNGNNKVDDITELIGEYSFEAPRLNTRAVIDKSRARASMKKHLKHAFRPLEVFNFNNDKVIDEQDSIFCQLKLWHDKDENGFCSEDEMHDLEEYGIRTISLRYTDLKDSTIQQAKYISYSVSANNQTFKTYSVVFESNKEGDMLQSFSIDILHNSTAAGNCVSDSVLESSCTFSTLRFCAPESSSICSPAASSARGLIGDIVRSETGFSSLMLKASASIPFFVSNHSVENVYGSTGDDELHGDNRSNWIFGNDGKDKIFLGDGNDVCVIDAQDDPAFIDGGSGFNIAYATGNAGITFIMAPSRINQIYGTSFADFIAVGRDLNGSAINGFVDAGDGDDLAIGDEESDVISGGNDDDHILGMEGNDILRGGSGNDIIDGGQGGDVIDAGDGDDICFGMEGDDTLKGGRGNDKLHGGTGQDHAEYSSSFEEYRLERLADEKYIITDLCSNRDGVDELTDIENLVFNSGSNPFTVKLANLSHGYPDFIPLSVGVTSINPTALLKNDLNYSGQEIYICDLHDTLYNEVTAIKSGDKVTHISFTPKGNSHTVKSFGYTLCTQTLRDQITRVDTDESAIYHTRVFLTQNDHPDDNLFYKQWYLSYTSVLPAWQFYSGLGTTVLVNEAVADYTHEDLKDNLKDYETPEESFSVHATTVAGVIGAAKNSLGLVGIAYKATLASHRDTSVAHKKYDVINRSWKWSEVKAFVGNMSEAQELHITRAGRRGLGTVIVQSAGNSREKGDNTNDYQQTNSVYSLVVGAIYKDASLSYAEFNTEAFSNKGASVLISAPGSHILTSSTPTINDNGNVFTWNYDMVKGTSFSAPIVSGIVALMLEANAYLGYRDVQKILAISARSLNALKTQWHKNADKTWNLEGMHYNHDYGFGCVDAYTAVKFAEHWPYTSTAFNVRSVSVSSPPLYKAIDSQQTFQGTLTLEANIQIQNVMFSYDISHANFSNISIALISPRGSKSILKEQGKTNINTANIKFRALSHHFLGEKSRGNWTYEVTNHHNIQLGFLHGANLTVFGDILTSQIVVITSEVAQSYHVLANLRDTDIIFMPSISDNLLVELCNGQSFSAAGASFEFKGEVPKHFVSGTGHDTLVANHNGSTLYSNDGHDKLRGQAGNDLLVGGRGNDHYTGGGGTNVFVVHCEDNMSESISDFASEDFLILINCTRLATETHYEPAGTNIKWPNNQIVSLNNFSLLLTSPQVIFLNHFTYYLFAKARNYHRISTNVNQLIIGQRTDDVLHGSEARDLIIGNGGKDIISGWGGDDTIICGDGNCIAYGHDGNDIIRTGHGRNRVSGGAGYDIFVPGLGAMDYILDFDKEQDRIDLSNFRLTYEALRGNTEVSPCPSSSDLNCAYLNGMDWQIILIATEVKADVFIF